MWSQQTLRRKVSTMKRNHQRDRNSGTNTVQVIVTWLPMITTAIKSEAWPCISTFLPPRMECMPEGIHFIEVYEFNRWYALRRAFRRGRLIIDVNPLIRNTLLLPVEKKGYHLLAEGLKISNSWEKKRKLWNSWAKIRKWLADRGFGASNTEHWEQRGYTYPSFLTVQWRIRWNPIFESKVYWRVDCLWIQINKLNFYCVKLAESDYSTAIYTLFVYLSLIRTNHQHCPTFQLLKISIS